MDRMNSADEMVFEEALSGALADIQSAWENPAAGLRPFPPVFQKNAAPAAPLKKTAIWFFRRRQTLDSQIGGCFVGGIAELCGS